MPTAVELGLEPQSARAVLMVRPARFGFNPQTAASNAFQIAPGRNAAMDQQLQASVEFDHMAQALQRAGVEVLVAADTHDPAKPDAIFPNNWVSFHGDGTVVLYPMMALNRRWERREDILQQVVSEGRFHVSRTIDLTHRETEGKFLEGTGSMVLDRTHRMAYANPSPRTGLDVLGEFAQLLDYELAIFDALDAVGQPVYHTNVVMAIGSRFAVVCGEAIAHAQHRSAVFSKLRGTGHDIVDLSLAQMRDFAGNVLELAAPGGPVLAISTTALRSLDPAQRRVLETHAGLLPLDVPTIERFGGGGVRCMLAEVHLPKRD
ncbi:MAG: arginine deiminase-related protein [Pseudomonadota bacterium]|nr:arginine deiminase-related protein [Pseudomonadota bacterium]